MARAFSLFGSPSVGHLRTCASLVAAALCSSRLGYGQPKSCGAPYVSVAQTQGDGSASPHVGRTLELEATVSADFRGGERAFGQLHLVFVQDVPADTDPHTSDGLAVVTRNIQSSSTFEPGTRLRILGQVQEVNNETQLVAEEVVVCGVGPAPIAQSTTLPFDAEAFEGVWVSIDDTLRLSAMHAFAEYGELEFVTNDLVRAFSDRFWPDAKGFEAYEAAVNARTVVLDDGFDERYRKSMLDTTTLRLGATLVGPTRGVVRPALNSAAFRLEPTFRPQLTAPELPLPLPARNAESVRVVSTNLHNLFKDGGDTGQCYPTYDTESCRGPNAPSERKRLRELIASQLVELAPDIIVGVEVQNDFGDATKPTWQLLIEDMNAVTMGACARYEALLPDVHLGTDAIAVALAYCADRLEGLGVFWPSTEWLQTLTPDEQGYVGLGASRLPIAASFRQRDTDFRLTVVANHWKSRSPGALQSSCTTSSNDDDCDQYTGEGYWSASRLRAAKGLLRWLESPDQVSSQLTLLAGDFNAYTLESPLQLLVDNGYESLVRRAGNKDHFSYAYNSRAGYLDHLFVSRRDVGNVAAFAAVPGNTEGFGVAPSAYSDHNPLFVDLIPRRHPSEAPHTCACDAPNAILGTLGDDILLGTPGDDILCGLAGNDVLLGLGGNDCLDAGLGDDWLMNGPTIAHTQRALGRSIDWCTE